MCSVPYILKTKKYIAILGFEGNTENSYHFVLKFWRKSKKVGFFYGRERKSERKKQHFKEVKCNRLIENQHFTEMKCNRLIEKQHFMKVKCDRLIEKQHFIKVKCNRLIEKQYVMEINCNIVVRFLYLFYSFPLLKIMHNFHATINKSI